ncbi:MAG: aminotransferase class V-fold PLP-dependent enzyme [Actinobacteria bacterium]|nr:aminotransferase class V-fold PLP-dependent enzyme [Actinomycetota bacterium]MDQ3532945.1 aminotransferase class V-fold PLP-dependent enzyme [Actinomycetota bacterium]
MSTLPVAGYRSQWRPRGVYLNTASYGLPPESAWNALQQALEGWRAGGTSWEPWGAATEGARTAFAALVGVESEEVAIGSTVSGLLGPVAASLPDGSRVLVPDEEFTSNLWPYLVQGNRGVRVRTVPAAQLADAIDGNSDVVAFSAVQSATGEVADLHAIEASARHHGALTIVDATQACGWLPLDASCFDFVVCAAYKWLMSPRGSAFLTVRPERLGSVRPTTAGWYAGENVHSSYYGMPLRLARSTRRLDTSPAWFSWVGTQPAIELVNRIGVPAIQRHNVELANTFRSGLGMDPGNSAIVPAEVPGAAAKLEGTGILASTRAGKLRTAWHVYNTRDDVALTLKALL